MKLSHILLLSAFLLSFQANAMDPIDDGRPNEHFCPITREVMRDPVVAADGHSYERREILKWVSRGNTTSPITRLPLKNQELLDNHALKAMIHEWKPGQQNAPSALATKSAESIAQRVKEEFARNAALLNSAKDKHIVAFLGNTGAGKSTLVNLLAGKKLIVSDDGQDYILADANDSTAMVIGTSGSSETLYPKSIDVDGLRFFDLPGFNDTDGSERNLINAAFTRQILLDAASVRLVFVAGQDQFTADRSTSVKQMFHAIKQLFVTEQGTNLVDNGIFVATKMICSAQADLTDFLLKKTNAQDKAELHAQLKAWSASNKLCRVFHPVLEDSNKGIRDHILSLIKEAKPVKIHGINVSVLYPSNTKGPLERMFLSVLGGAFERKMKVPLITLPDYDRAIMAYTSPNFWQTFDGEVSGEEKAIGLLKEFCINPYKNAFETLKKENENKGQTHVQHLKTKRQERIKNIEDRTKTKAEYIISSIVPKKENDNFVSFDFAYHKDFHEEICGPNSISHLATDPQEQDIVRSYYAGFISQHSHQQVMEWHQKFSGIESLKKQVSEIENLSSKIKIQGTEIEDLKKQVNIIRTRKRQCSEIETLKKQAREIEALKKKVSEIEKNRNRTRPRWLSQSPSSDDNSSNSSD